MSSTASTPEDFHSPFLEGWDCFEAELLKLDRELLADCQAAWDGLDRITRQLESSGQSDELQQPEAAGLSSLTTLFEEVSERLLGGVLRQYERERPQRQVLNAIERHRNRAEELVRSLPEQIDVAGPEVAAAFKAAPPKGLKRRWLARQHRSRPVPLRRAMQAELMAELGRRSEPKDALLLAMTHASLGLLEPWKQARDSLLRRLQAPHSEDAKPAEHDEIEQWNRAVERQRRDAKQAIEALGELARDLPRRMEQTLLRRPPGEPYRGVDPLVESTVYWGRQRQAVVAEHQLELQLAEVARSAIRESRHALQSAVAEHAELVAEWQELEAWLDSWQPDRTAAIPAPRSRLTSADERLRSWSSFIAEIARKELPAEIESVLPGRALPRWRQPWRKLNPLQRFLEALEGQGRSIALQGFTSSQDSYRALLREMDRAREVVAYGSESLQAEGGEEQLQLASEAIENALTLIRHQERSLTSPMEPVEPALAQAVAATLQRCCASLEQSRLGLIASVTRERGVRSATAALYLLGEYTRKLRGSAWKSARNVHQAGMARIGWVRLPERNIAAVETRTFLEPSRRIDPRARDLPLIYSRLFRLEPVEDPRFLVGREAEMAAIGDARQLWEAGRSAAVMVVGERGSGKTSLINCARIRGLHDLQTVHAVLSQRIDTPARMQSFLEEALNCRPGELAQTLSSERRVLILEGLEKAFLRRVGGFEGVRYLVSLMSSTGETTLWIVTVNQAAYRYLDPAVGLRQHFSHCINARTVSPKTLQEAILLRHNLSGLRLRFFVPPREARRLRRLRRSLGVENSRQEAFFEALHEQSEGIFRAAFEHWYGLIERAEGGVVYMKYPVPADYRRLIAGLTGDDLFCLNAVLQHGSLTVEEYADVFGISQDEGHTRLEGLVDRGILEPEPGEQGWRIRPEAGYLVRRALDAENLL